jgi:lambda family phage portal protein
MGYLRDAAARLLTSAAAVLSTPQPMSQPVTVKRAEPGMRAYGANPGLELGGRGRRLHAIPATTTAINTLIMAYGTTVVARSRYLCTNNPYAVAAKETFVSAMAGFGIKPSTLGETKDDKAQVQELWLDWCAEADADHLQDFYGQQAMVSAELFEAGECFAVEVDAPGNSTVPLSYRIYPAEMLPYQNDVMPTSQAAPGNYIYMGIEFTPTGERAAYHFYKRHPGEALPQSALSDIGTIRIPAEKVLHMFRPIRAGQQRGIPFTLSALVTLAMLDLYDDAELERKRVAALFAAFITKNPQEGSTPDSPLGQPEQDPVTANMVVTMEPGATVELNPGEDVSFATPADVGNSYEAFQYRQLLRAAAGFGVPYAEMTGDLRQANYGSIRAGLVAFRRRVTALQNHVLIFQFCRPIWVRWHDVAAAMKPKKLPWTFSQYMKDRAKHLRVRWIPPKWDWVDPAKDIAAEKIAVDNGFKARADTIEEQGYDPEETDARIISDMEREEEFPRPLNTGQQPPADPNADDAPAPPANKEPTDA